MPATRLNTFNGNDSITTNQIANNSITSAKIADNAIVTADITDSAVTTSKITDSAVTAAKMGYQNFSFRNRIINGDMRIDQRNAGASITPATGQYSVDRWNFQLSQTSKLTAQRQAVSNPQQADNNTFCLVATVSSAYTVTASDYFLIAHFIEGFNCADLGWGTSGAKAVTLSFWTYSSIAGTFGGVIANSATSRSYPFTYQISSVSTWEKKTITLAGDTSGTWLTDNGIGIRLYFGLGVGSTFSAPAGSWTTGFLGANGATSIMGTNGATFVITGVQLEVGSTATEFERRPFGAELALCQRYFEKGYFHSAGYVSVGAGVGGSIYFRSEKRAVPQVVYTNIVTANVGTTTTNQRVETDSVGLYRVGSTSNNYQYEQSWTASAELT